MGGRERTTTERFKSSGAVAETAWAATEAGAGGLLGFSFFFFRVLQI